MDPQDVKIIESIHLGWVSAADRDGWHFINNGRYTVKSRYQVERVYPDRDMIIPEYGLLVNPLKGFFAGK